MLILTPELRKTRLISDDYRRQQMELHKNPDYGTTSAAYAPIISKLCDQYSVSTIQTMAAASSCWPAISRSIIQCGCRCMTQP